MTREDDLAERLADMVGNAALHEPEFRGKEAIYLADCLESGWVSSAGPNVGIFEEAVAAFTGAAGVVAVVNGTAALALAYRVAGVRRDDEVLMPALTFVATANAASMLGAVPHFVDCDSLHPGLSSEHLRNHLTEIAETRAGELINKRTGRRIGAIVAVHVFGHPCDLSGLSAVAKDFGIPLIEDAAAALGSRHGEVHAGLGGLVGTLSFNGNKVLTTGGGGALISMDRELIAHARHLASTAKVPHPFEFEHDQIAYNFRMPNLNAALGIGQMEQLAEKILSKRNLAARYRSFFEDYPDLRFIEERSGTFSIYWLNSIQVMPEAGMTQTRLLEALMRHGVQARPLWRPMHQLEIYRQSPRADLPNTDRLYASVISLPSSPKLGREQ